MSIQHLQATPPHHTIFIWCFVVWKSTNKQKSLSSIKVLVSYTSQCAQSFSFCQDLCLFFRELCNDFVWKSLWSLTWQKIFQPWISSLWVATWNDVNHVKQMLGFSLKSAWPSFHPWELGYLPSMVTCFLGGSNKGERSHSGKHIMKGNSQWMSGTDNQRQRRL